MNIYDNQLWISTDNDLWVEYDDFIWIPYTYGDGYITFVLSPIKYHFDALSTPFVFVAPNQQYNITAERNKYCFVCNKLDGWFKGV